MRSSVIALAIAAAATGIVFGDDTRETRLYVRTIPAGAKVVVDGKEIGVSDSLHIILPGDHRVTLEMEGYEAEEHHVTVPAKRITRLVVTLTEKRGSGESLSPETGLEEHIAFIAPGSDDRDALFLMPLSGGDRVRVPLPGLPGEGTVHNPQWSPDGRWITFHGGKGHNAQIYAVRPDGSDFHRVTDGSGNCTMPSLSPDGARIVFNRAYGHLYTVQNDGHGLNDLGITGSNARWSPVGDRIVYTNWNTSGPGDLFVLDAAGKTVQQLTYSTGQAYNYAMWSPDGRKLVAHVGRQNAARRLTYDLYVMNADGSGQVNVTGNLDPENERNEHYPSWTSDGRHIVFLRDATGRFDLQDIWIMRADGSDPRNLTRTRDVSEDMPAVGWRATGEGHGASVPSGDGTLSPGAPTLPSQAQRDAARRAGVEPDIEVDLGEGVTMKMVLIPAGTFVMGSPASEEGRDAHEVQHEVTISKPFYLGATEVTQAQWEALMGNNPSSSKGRDLPVDSVWWDDCQTFIRRLNAKVQGGGFRLATESEWEYACRAGTRTRFHSGDADRDLDAAGWYSSNSGGKTHPVAGKRPNAWGLYDMHGNVWEWCENWYGEYPRERVADPMGPPAGPHRVLRGGGWDGQGRDARAATRITLSLPARHPHYLPRFGFRVARTLPAPQVGAQSTPSQAQRDAARRAGVEPAIEVDLGAGVTMKMALIEPGEFLMGSPVGEAGRRADEAQHEVKISKPFYMGAYEVTRAQFAAFVKDNGYETVAEKEGWSGAWDGQHWGRVNGASWQRPGFEQTDDHPAVCLAWSDAAAFCEWLSGKARRAIRLPTEAEWEYACRAGTTTAYQWGNNPADGRGWCNVGDLTQKDKMGPFLTVFSWRDGFVFTAPVASFEPNARGLYDMHGNAAEWCADWYGEYPRDRVTDPTGPANGTHRVLRGGAWSNGPISCRAAVRERYSMTGRDIVTGFRCVMEAAGAAHPIDKPTVVP